MQRARIELVSLQQCLFILTAAAHVLLFTGTAADDFPQHPGGVRCNQHQERRLRLCSQGLLHVWLSTSRSRGGFRVCKHPSRTIPRTHASQTRHRVSRIPRLQGLTALLQPDVASSAHAICSMSSEVI